MGLFDDLVDPSTTVTQDNTVTAQVEASAPVDSTVTESTESTESDKPARETITVESLEQLPDGYVDVKGFAWALTTDNLQKARDEQRHPTQDDMIDTQAVYAATRGKNWSLPAVEAVHPNGTKLGIVIPLQAGREAWAQRPERGTGIGTTTMTPEKREERLRRAGLAKARLAKLQARVQRYNDVLLPQVGATWEDADKVFEAWVETEEGKKAAKDFAGNGSDD